LEKLLSLGVADGYEQGPMGQKCLEKVTPSSSTLKICIFSGGKLE
jgi:hypothetical protein